MSETQTRVAPRKVSFLNEREDFFCALMGAMGFGTDFISEATGLSAGQVSYRLNKAAIKRAQYRRGESWEAQAVLKMGQQELSSKLTTELRKKGLK
jgi:hypothetical protein